MKKIILFMFIVTAFVNAQILNSSFESGTTNWIGDLNLTITEENTQVYDGSKSLNCTFNSTTQANCDLRSDMISGLSPSISYTISAWFYDNDPSGRANLVFEWYDASGTLLSASYYSTYTADQASWQKLTYTVTSPANTAKCKIGSRFYDVAGWDGDCTIYVDLFEGTPAPLPVELTSFTAFNSKGGVELNWSTATEVNNYGFDVERQILKQVQNDSNGWEKIGFVQGHGNSNSPKDYSFIDQEKVAERSRSYRLKQLDFDGSFHYSDVVSVNNALAKSFKLFAPYPNPFNPNTTIKFSIPAASNVSLKIYDIIGNEIANLVNGRKDAGEYEVDFNAKNLPSGIYFSTLRSNGNTQTQKLILMK